MSDVRKASRSVKNRVQSILDDTDFVSEVEKAYQRPLVANKRCGLWYVPTKQRRDTCYFKSTDGHTGQWAFSLRRLNLHLIPHILSNKGIILVDSTRRGKAMPDAFSKTVPVWAAVLNRAVFGVSSLYVPPGVVSPSEKAQIENSLDDWAAQLRNMVDPELYEIDKPLRPIWVTQEGILPLEPPQYDDFYPVVLCMASRRAQDGELQLNGFTYVQGAGDDHEMWAGKLTPDILWTHPVLQTQLSESEFEKVLDELPAESARSSISLTPYLTTSTTPSAEYNIDLIHIGPGKKGARQVAPLLDAIVQAYASRGPTACIVCQEVDLGTAIALLLNCLFFDNNGDPMQMSRSCSSKENVAKRLVPIAHTSGVIPNRYILNVVGSYLRN